MRLLQIAIVLLLGGVSIAAQEARTTFNFAPERRSVRHITVTPSDVYDKTKGFGFEPGAEVTCPSDRTCFSNKPFYFSVALREGNYRVMVIVGNSKENTSTTIKAELRRLMLEKIEVAAGNEAFRKFVVNVRTPLIPGGDAVKLKDREKNSEQWAWDEKLTLEFNGLRPSIHTIEIQRVDVLTVFLLGDSTVCDQPGEPYASWGQMITRFFNTRVSVANHAESGESLKSSLSAKRLDKVLSLMRPGDYLLIQYGHNDEKEKGEGIGAFTSYKASLKLFIEGAKAKGGKVILLNPMHRRTFDADGKVTNSHGDYPEAVRQAAKKENVPLIDLTAMSKDLYEAFGKEGSGVLFKEGDGTHHNAYGAYQIAKIIVQSIRDQRLPLSKYLIKGLPKYDPKRPDDPKQFSLPPSPSVAHAKPLGS